MGPYMRRMNISHVNERRGVIETVPTTCLSFCQNENFRRKRE